MDWTTGIRFPAGAGILSSPPRRDRLRVHPASYPMGTGGSFPRSKEEGAWRCRG